MIQLYAGFMTIKKKKKSMGYCIRTAKLFRKIPRLVDELLRPVDKGLRPKTGNRFVVHGVDIRHDNIFPLFCSCEFYSTKIKFKRGYIYIYIYIMQASSNLLLGQYRYRYIEYSLEG